MQILAKISSILPIFIPHAGCPHQCVFCNQKKITARTSPVTSDDVVRAIETYLSTLKDMNLETIEIAFYGGSFTGLPIEKQNEYLSVAKHYKDAGKVDKIHLSTRPDYISDDILVNLKSYSVDVIELGVQSFDPEVLELSNRGHSSDVVYKASEMIKDFGFTLGIQLMVGLPGDTLEKDIYSAKETVKIAPEIARIYPTVVIEDTELYEMSKDGRYIPLTLEDSILRTKEMYKILDDAEIKIIRIGLKSSDIINSENVTFHPAIRQLVEGEIARDIVDPILKNISQEHVTIYANSKWLSNLVGNGGINRKHWESEYPNVTFTFKVDDSLDNKVFKIE